MGRITKPSKENSRVPLSSTNGKITKAKTFSKQELIERQRKAKEQANALSRLNTSPKPTLLPRMSISTRSVFEPKASTSGAAVAKPTKSFQPKKLNVSKPSTSFANEGFKFVAYASSLAAIKNQDGCSSDRRMSLAKKKASDRPRPSLHPLGINVFDKNTSEEDKRKVYDFMKQRTQTKSVVDTKVRFQPIAEERGSDHALKEAEQAIPLVSKTNSPQPAPEVKQPASILKKKLFAPLLNTSAVSVQEVGSTRKSEGVSLRTVKVAPSPIQPMSAIKSQSRTRGEKMFTPLKKPAFSTDSESSSEEAPDYYSYDQLVNLTEEKLKDIAKNIKIILAKRNADSTNNIPSPILPPTEGVTPITQGVRRKSTRISTRRRSTRSCSVASTVDPSDASLVYPVTHERTVTIREDIKENMDRSRVSLKHSVSKEERRAEFRLQQERLLLNMQRREGQTSFTTTPRVVRKPILDTSFESETY